MIIKNRTAVIGAMLLAALVYLPALANGFAWDDDEHVVQNQSLHGFGRLGEVVRSPYLRDRSPVLSPYRPATSVSFALSWAMGNGAPGPFHFFNVAAHAVVTGLVALLLLALGASTVAAAAGAGLFAVHPVHVEAVANVVGRADVLLTMGAVLGALLWLRRDLPPLLRASGVVLACALAVGSKETGAVLPALLILLDVLRGRGSAHRLWLNRGLLAGAAVVVVAYLAARKVILGVFGTYDVAPYIAILPGSLRVSTAVANFAQTARLLVWPADLAADYAPGVIQPAAWGSARFLAGLAVAGGAAALAWVDGRRVRAAPTGGTAWFALAAAWIAIACFPVSNLLVQVPIWLAERTLYLPSVGVAFVAAGSLDMLRRGRSPGVDRAAAALIVLLLTLGGWRCWTRSTTWRDTDTVLAALAEEHPESYRAQWWAASKLMEAGLQDRALDRYREALALNPNDVFLTLDFARALILAGQSTEAERLMRPINAGRDPSRSVYLAQSLIEQGRNDEARAVVREGLEHFPTDPRLRGQAEALGVPL